MDSDPAGASVSPQTESGVAPSVHQSDGSGVSTHGTVHLSPDGRVRTISKSAADLLRQPAEAIVGQLIDDLLDGVGDVPRRREGGPTTPPAQPIERQVAATLAGGRKLMLEASIEAAPDDPTETLVRLRDNNESLEIRSRMENQATRLNDLQRQLSRIDKFTALGQVTGRIIHEVGNPLAAIKARIQAAQADPDQYNPADVLADVLRDVRRLESFMDLVTRSRRNPLAVDPANFERLEIGAVLADVHDLLVAEVQQRELDLFVILEPGLPPIAGDSGLLRHLFTNLVRNAIEASEPGTRILLRSERHRRTEAGPFRIRVRVVDQGRGIPAHIENDVWSPFVSSKPDGSGLGLSICRDIVEGHNGSIRLYNHPAGRPGCTASLVFPASPATPDDSGAAQAQPPPPPG